MDASWAEGENRYVEEEEMGNEMDRAGREQKKGQGEGVIMSGGPSLSASAPSTTQLTFVPSCFIFFLPDI